MLRSIRLFEVIDSDQIIGILYSKLNCKGRRVYMKALKVIRQLREGAFNGDLDHIYCVKTQDLTYYKDRIESAIDGFEKTYGENRDIFVFSSPGRCEICGNHTDHQRGNVLAAAINLDIIAIVALNNNETINLKSDDYDLISVDLKEQKTETKGTTAAIVRGVADGFKKAGYRIYGFDCFTVSDVLVGSGLSSSAAFEILMGTVINHLFCKLEVPPLDIAKIGQYAENNYFGKPSGLMDQTACAVGGFVNMDFEDTTAPKIESLTLDLDKFDYAMCIVDTHSSHQDLTCEYAQIPEDMKKVARYFKKEVLRQVDSEEFFNEIKNIRKVVKDRPLLRAIHFFNEQIRVKTGFEALKRNDFDTFLRVITDSGRSSFCWLQNVYSQNDVNNQGISVALALCERFFKDKKGAYRIHGGGFAGTIEVFLPNPFTDSFKRQMEAVFGDNSCYFLKIRSVGGIKLI